jgi:hypothetical protein
MDPITLALVIVAGLSEMLPLLGFTRANGLLHGIQTFIIHINAQSECHVDLEVTQAPGGTDGPAAIAPLAATPP